MYRVVGETDERINVRQTVEKASSSNHSAKLF